MNGQVHFHLLEKAYATEAYTSTGPREQCWDIAWLATSPKHQGEGHGKALMVWVIEQGTREKVALSVISAYGKDGFYNKLGYVVESGRATDGEKNPLHNKSIGGKFWWREEQLKYT
jgi:GNAT superfamily N-acetyltransferase